MARISNQEHRETSIAAVLAAAEYLFVTRGYNGTTTADIGKLAGLTKGAVYFYFPDKEAILLELLNAVRQSVLVPMRVRLRNKDLSPAQRIGAFLAYGGQIAQEFPGSMLLPIVVSIEFAGTNSTGEQRVKAGYRKVSEEVQRVLEEGQANGEIRSDLDAAAMASALIATNDGLMLECLRNDLELQVGKLVATLNGIVQIGISREAAHHKASAIPLKTEKSARLIDVLKSRLPKPRKPTSNDTGTRSTQAVKQRTKLPSAQ
jgi:AcrR family transcriptional regulator